MTTRGFHSRLLTVIAGMEEWTGQEQGTFDVTIPVRGPARISPLRSFGSLSRPPLPTTHLGKTIALTSA